MKKIILYILLLSVGLLAACNGPGSPPVVINEIMSSNQSCIADEDGEFEDWIELYNAGNEAVNLEGYYLSDKPKKPLIWKFPKIVLQPGEHLVVWASGKDRRDGDQLHTNFRINRQGEPLTLTMPDGRTAVDRVKAVYIPQDTSYGRLADGEIDWRYLLVPTPGSSNEKSREHTLPDGYFDEPAPESTPFAWLAIIVLSALFIPLFIAFLKKTKR